MTAIIFQIPTLEGTRVLFNSAESALSLSSVPSGVGGMHESDTVPDI